MSVRLSKISFRFLPFTCIIYNNFFFIFFFYNNRFYSPSLNGHHNQFLLTERTFKHLQIILINVLELYHLRQCFFEVSS